MHKINRLCFILFITSFTTLTYAFSYTTENADPHFYIQMENHSEKNASITFQPVKGNVSLAPVLNSHTELLAHKQSAAYGVVFNPLGRDDQFNIVFNGKENCAFNVAFYAPYNPKITISGLGCFGGGYKIEGNVLKLFISDIHFKK